MFVRAMHSNLIAVQVRADYENEHIGHGVLMIIDWVKSETISPFKRLHLYLKDRPILIFYNLSAPPFPNSILEIVILRRNASPNLSSL